MKHDLPQIIIIDIPARRNVDTTVAHGNVSISVVIFGGFKRESMLKYDIQTGVSFLYTEKTMAVPVPKIVYPVFIYVFPRRFTFPVSSYTAANIAVAGRGNPTNTV